MLEEIGGPYELTKLTPAERRGGEHLARHPLGRVPAFELDPPSGGQASGGTVIFESAAICLQLADLNPQAGLIGPLGSTERALAYQWVAFAMTELEAPLYRWIRELAAGTADASSGERFEQAAAALQTALDGHDWLVAERFGVADLLCVSVLGSAHSREMLGPWPGLVAYVERGEARPAFIAAAEISNQPRE
jgi:glutathione S-transferase